MQANTRHGPGVVSMVGHRHQSWPSIETVVGQRIVFTGMALLVNSVTLLSEHSKFGVVCVVLTLGQRCGLIDITALRIELYIVHC